ncbi:unnamed protein product [Cuscuta europaea]|uniref:Protein N-terminal asparagine amidohydrolase n=1 Tax=Cuscuta europaea TaxID=41803 RepID=A0A9P0YTT7_CUSEU|nr:unnamed protein product [Cuscuta europaea]
MHLMMDRRLKSRSREFNGIREVEHSFCDIQKTKLVYIMQKEYATVNPSLVDAVGTDGLSTCVGLIIRNPKNRKISVAHIDIPNIVEAGLGQMLSSISDQDSNASYDVHLIGGYKDISYEHKRWRQGVSLTLCSKIIEVLFKSPAKFNIQTLHVLDHNTQYDREKNAYRIFEGFIVKTDTGSILPARFHETTKGPAIILREARRSLCVIDSNWKNRLLYTYDTDSDRYIIAPISWDETAIEGPKQLLGLSDEDFAKVYYYSPPLQIDHDYIRYLKRKPRAFMRIPNGE